MTISTIPHSGDFMRLFARTPMTGAALRIATTLAGYISYDGKFRGAPHGFAAFTMKELQAITGPSSAATTTGTFSHFPRSMTQTKMPSLTTIGHRLKRPIFPLKNE